MDFDMTKYESSQTRLLKSAHCKTLLSNYHLSSFGVVYQRRLSTISGITIKILLSILTSGHLGFSLYTLTKTI